MHRIDTVTAQKDKFGAGKNGFTRGNPQTGTPATDLDDDYFDMLQEELCAVVEESGEELDKGKHNQLLTALRSLLLSRSNPFGDIASDGPEAIATALANLGLEESAFGYKNMVVFSAPGVVNWVVPDELRKGRKCYVKVIGGGGSGGRASGGGGGGGGGGPGGQGAVDASTHDGIDAYGPGGGGAGAALGAPAVAGRGGKGGNGVIIIRW